MQEIDRRSFVLGGMALGVSTIMGLSSVGCTASSTEAFDEAFEEPIDTMQELGTDSGKAAGEAMAPGQAASEVDTLAAADNTTEYSPLSGKPVVYFTSNINPDGLVQAFKALNVQPSGKVAVKISTGEPGGNNFLKPSLISNLVKLVEGTIVECNTAYGWMRAQAASHYQVAADHGFTAIADVDIMDEKGSTSLPVKGGKHLEENLVGERFGRYDFYVILSHFKGHGMAGYGGAIKNVSIGIASSAGKSLIHSAGKQTTGTGSGTSQEAFLESMVESAKSVADCLGDNIIYINVMNRLSVDCDCSSNPAEPEMADIGILASTDMVALDQACVDLVYSASDSGALIERIESRNGLHTLTYSETFGLGSRSYDLVPL